MELDTKHMRKAEEVIKDIRSGSGNDLEILKEWAEELIDEIVQYQLHDWLNIHEFGWDTYADKVDKFKKEI